MLRIYTTLLIGVLVISFGSIFTRWVGDVPFAVISFYRLLLTLPVLLIIYFTRNQKIRNISKFFNLQYVAAGFFLAAHFITWIASIQMTSVANSIFLESTHPFFGLILSIFILKENPRPAIIPTYVLALIGIFLIILPQWDLSHSQTMGDILAIFSALFLALYLLVARFNRDRIELILYLIYVYGFAAIFCAIYIIINKLSFIGYSINAWLFMVLLALGPNLIGHSLLNWASRKIEIYKVNLMLLLEPVLATTMGIFFLYEFPEITFYTGALLIICSLLFLTLKEKLNSQP